MVAGTQNGIAIFDYEKGFYNYVFPAPHQYPAGALAFDLYHNLWIGQWDGTVTKISLAEWKIQYYTPANTHGTLRGGMIYAIINDWKGTCWFGSEHGLLRLQDTTWTSFTRRTHPSSVLPSDMVTALSIDHHRNLWIGTPAGVAVYNPIGVKF